MKRTYLTFRYSSERYYRTSVSSYLAQISRTVDLLTNASASGRLILITFTFSYYAILIAEKSKLSNRQNFGCFRMWSCGHSPSIELFAQALVNNMWSGESSLWWTSVLQTGSKQTTQHSFSWSLSGGLLTYMPPFLILNKLHRHV